MDKINLRDLSLSELSFIVILKSENVDLQNQAYSEINRRFAKNGCGYDAFMEYEEEAIERGGRDISNYLISKDVNAQKLMEVYFNQVYNQGIWEHGNLLFSELMLCNGNSGNTFFTKAVKLELARIKKRIAVQEDIGQLQLVYNILLSRLKLTLPFWEENDLIDCVMDITNSSFIMSERKIEKLEKSCQKLKERKLSKLGDAKIVLNEIIYNSDVLNNIAMICFANSDSAKLSSQKSNIIRSIKSGENIDYSFVDEKKILSRKGQVFTIN